MIIPVMFILFFYPFVGEFNITYKPATQTMAYYIAFKIGNFNRLNDLYTTKIIKMPKMK